MDSAIYSAPKVDCHCHVLDPAGFSYADDVAYRPAGQETGSADYFVQVLDAYGVKHALLVGPNSGYGTDNRCLLDAIARHGERFKGIAVVPDDASATYLQELKGQGVVGIAFNFALHGLHYYRNPQALMERLAAQDLFVQIQVCEDQLAQLSPMILDSGAQVLIDHCGRPDLTAGLDGKGFNALIRLAESQRATVKLSGFAKFSLLDFPFSDVHPFIDALLVAFGPDHCVWASDWPFLKAPRRLDYGTLLQLFVKTVTNAEDRRKILLETPNRIFGFAGDR
jgi:predicted TIM-barrel fold metal-dependent hydrolase